MTRIRDFLPTPRAPIGVFTALALSRTTRTRSCSDSFPLPLPPLDGKEKTLHAGETFYEGPRDVHTVGRNASRTKPARFVVFLLKDKDRPALIPVGRHRRRRSAAPC
jgi:hypothetical protein